MSDWYYAKGGQQNGPVSREHLAELLQNGTLNPGKDLIWNSTMKDWLPAAQVPEFSTRTTGPVDPYSTPASSWEPSAPLSTGESLAEIEHGSDPINVIACVKRGFELTVRSFGMILLVGIVYFAVVIGVGAVIGAIEYAAGWGHYEVFRNAEGMITGSRYTTGYLSMIVNQLLGIFLALGLCRILLNLVSGRAISIGMLFAGGKKFLPAIGASILFILMVFVGLALFIVPGIYLALRFGFYIYAMVDRDLGVFDSLRYSSSITTRNRLNLFGLSVFVFLIILAGVVALCVGLIFAIPVASLAWAVAYRWMQYGYLAAEDHPGTQTPMLSAGHRG
jgi:hypothetical protein